LKRIVLMLTCFAVAIALGVQPAPAADEGWVKLFNGKDLAGWKRFLQQGKESELDKNWTIDDGVIKCDGSINGYIITEKEYENYVLKLQWRWGTKVARGRNSGVFVHVVGPDKIWPKGVEAQLMADHAGDFWLVDNFKLSVDKARQDPRQARHYFRLKDKEKIEKPVGEWNQYEITCKGNEVKLVVNGEFVNEGKEAELAKGKILLQSEGAEIHFRNIELKPLK
jgi:hypothetical protein